MGILDKKNDTSEIRVTKNWSAVHFLVDKSDPGVSDSRFFFSLYWGITTEKVPLAEKVNLFQVQEQVTKHNFARFCCSCLVVVIVI